EVSLDIINTPLAYLCHYAPQPPRGAWMGEVKRRAILPHHAAGWHRLAGRGVPYRPVRVLTQDLAAPTEQSGRDPDPGPPAGAADPAHQPGQARQPARGHQPVAGRGLVPVVYLHHAELKTQLVHGGQVRGDVRLGHRVVVLVPGTPGRRDGPPPGGGHA